ncbi:MAG: glycosyl hydrolase family 65 protein [Gaiellales bacterium]
MSTRAERPALLADVMEPLLTRGVTLVVITGTTARNVSGQIAPLLSVAARQRLYLMVNRGSEVYAYSTAGELERIWLREATAAENAALDRVAEQVRARLAAEYGLTVGIVSDRLNRRKIDLIPEPEWADPPKSRIGELLEAVEERLSGVPGGIAGVIDLASRVAAESGLPNARITSDVKHVEVGLTDKSDSIAFLMRRLAPMRGIRVGEVLIAGDEFGPIAGFEGSDYRMVTKLAAGATLLSVGREPNGVPAGVVHLDGGPPAFVRVLKRRLALLEAEPEEAARLARPAPEPRPRAADGWTVRRHGYDPVGEASEETLFALVNGYMGVRGSSDEPNPGGAPGAYIAGLFDGPNLGDEDLVAIPDWTTVELTVAGRRLEPWLWQVHAHERTLELAAMSLRRRLVCADPDGRVLELVSERLISLAEPHLGAVRLSLRLESGEPAAVELRVGARAREQTGTLPHAEMVAAGHLDGIDMLHTRTPGARVSVDVGQSLNAAVDGHRVEAHHLAAEDFSGSSLEALLAPGQALTVERFVAIFTEREARLPAVAAANLAREALRHGFEQVMTAHRAAWEAAWERADVEIDGDLATQVGVRFSIAHLTAIAPPVESRASIGAKGLTGFGYKGHVFWDTDIFLMPFYSLVWPEIARRLLDYRIHALPSARVRAEQAGYAGAWFPWESAASGEDVTPDFVVGPGGRHLDVLTGHQEIHVVADIAWAADAYRRITGDETFMHDGGGSLIVEAARYFASRVVETDRGFEIHGVIGPDELHENVDNSAFTNTLAAWTLRRAADLFDHGLDGVPVAAGEPARWREIAERMLVLRSAEGLIEQHEGFLQLPLPPRGPDDQSELAWQRDRMAWRDVKQADVVMLMALLSDEYTLEQQLAHFNLYEPLTLHLSSLSEAVHSLVARRIGLDEKADDYLARAIRIDLEDSRGNRPEGIHMATQGGIWQAVVLGCGGIAAGEERLEVAPRLPSGWDRLRFRVEYRGGQLTVTVTPDQMVVEATSDRPVPIRVADWEGEATPGMELRFSRSEQGWLMAA